MNNEQLCVLAQQGNADAQNRLTENNFGFVRKIAHDVWSAQAGLNEALHIEPDDLMQEGLIALCSCVKSFDTGSGNQFLTYAAPAVRNAILDYIRSQNVSFEAKNLNDIVSLDEAAQDGVRLRHDFFADPARQTPEQIYLAKERMTDLHHALDMIDEREAAYLRYRFGFDDDVEHPLNETAQHFHLSQSRAKSTEKLALDNVWLELPWWY